MSKNKENWKTFLSTIFKGQNVKVKEVKDNNVCLSIPRGTSLEEIQKLLSSPEQLKSSIKHLTSENESQISPANKIIKPNKIREKYDGIRDIVKNVFSTDFLAYTEIKKSMWNDFTNDPISKTATLCVQGTKPVIKRDIAKFQILLNALSNPDLLEILHNSQGLYEGLPESNNDLLHEESETPSLFANEILQINVAANEKKATITFNYGKMLQQLQNKYPDNSTPIIAVNSKTQQDIEVTLEKEALLRYLEGIFYPGLIFKTEENKQITPIMFASKVASPDPHSFYLLLDVSGSMSKNFQDYIDRIKNIIGKIITEDTKGDISIIVFNSEIKQKTFSLKANNIKGEIWQYLDTLSADGSTNLNGAFIKALEDYKKTSTKDYTLIVFTDGENTVPEHTQEEVINRLSKEKANPNFHAYSFGFGSYYDEGFFKEVITKNGFSHTHLDSAKEFSVFQLHLENVASKVVLYEFVNNVLAEHYYKRLQSGEVEVGNPISENSVVKIHKGDLSTEYKVFPEEKPLPENIRDSIYTYEAYLADCNIAKERPEDQDRFLVCLLQWQAEGKVGFSRDFAQDAFRTFNLEEFSSNFIDGSNSELYHNSDNDYDGIYALFLEGLKYFNTSFLLG